MVNGASVDQAPPSSKALLVQGANTDGFVALSGATALFV